MSSCSSDLFHRLERNIGRIITVFTESGGCSGRGFTGVLIEVDDDFIRLITELPTRPSHPFGTGCNTNRSCCSNFGTTVVIPINKIVAVVFNEV